MIDCLSRADAELFLVEGIHAANALKRVRDRTNQAILPLQGKVPNASKRGATALAKNQQVANLITVLGGSSFEDLDNPYARIILLCDADHDGAHARSLLILLFHKYMRNMIEAGQVYVGLAPLYLIRTPDGKAHPAYNDEHRELVVQKLTTNAKLAPAKLSIDRFKGLASMSAEELHHYCVGPESRDIRPLSLADCVEVSKALGI